jgi:hypothetical protein
MTGDSNGDQDLFRRLLGASVRFADVIETPESSYTLSDEYNRAFMAADEDLREACLAYARSLSSVGRKRLAKL